MRMTEFITFGGVLFVCFVVGVITLYQTKKEKEFCEQLRKLYECYIGEKECKENETMFQKCEIESRVRVYPYKESSINEGQFLHNSTEPIEFSSVNGYKDNLVRITLPDGCTVVANSTELIVAIKKCVL